MKNSNSNKATKPFTNVVLACIWLASVITTGIWIYEGEGFYGDWVQYSIATLLLLIGCYDLVSIKKMAPRFKGSVILVIGIACLLPVIANLIPCQSGETLILGFDSLCKLYES